MKKSNIQEELKSSSQLISILSEMEILPDLRLEIDQYIKLQYVSSKDLPITNTVFRGNLHYIIDNIAKETLLAELKRCNANYILKIQ